MRINGQTQFIIDNVVNNDKVKSVLNIGYRHDSDPFIKNSFEKLGKTFTILEVYPDNCKLMRQNNFNVIEMNVLDIKTLDKNFDAIIWLHGPEHIEWKDFLNVRKDIEDKANHIVVYQAPIGFYPQGEIYGNPYEKHLTTLGAEMFKPLGYFTENHNTHGEFTFSAWIVK